MKLVRHISNYIRISVDREFLPICNTINRLNSAAYHSEQYSRNDGPGYGRRNDRPGRYDDFGDSFESLRSPVKWNADNMTEFSKNFYVESDQVKNRSQAEIQKYMEENEITVIGKNVPRPVFSFEEMQFPDYIQRTIAAQNYSQPSPIQAQGMPIALSGMDMVGRARTGSGKTAAFMLPAIVHIMNQQPHQHGDGPFVLVMVPTRELAQQCAGVAHDFGRPARVMHASVFGGAPRMPQLRQLQEGAQICIATPGRLLDYLQNGETNLRRCTYLVLDEADRMLDMGFEPQIRKIVNQLRPDRQTLMWSATWPNDVKNLAEDFLDHDSVKLMVGSGKLIANPNITQHISFCSDREKITQLYKVLAEAVKNERHKTLIFTTTKRTADRLAMMMQQANWPTDALHGDKSQMQRDRLLRDFRSGRTKFLIATDVASRGLDVSDIDMVINYDMPKNIEDYVHRIGRTARADRTFFSEIDYSLARDLIDILRKANQEVPQELERYQDYRSQGNQGSRGSNRWGNRRGGHAAY